MEKPLVSVIMPVYNGEKYIGKAIESVLAQNVPTELLVIDDCSTDKTELTVMKYMDSGNIRYIRNNTIFSNADLLRRLRTCALCRPHIFQMRFS